MFGWPAILSIMGLPLMLMGIALLMAGRMVSARSPTDTWDPAAIALHGFGWMLIMAGAALCLMLSLLLGLWFIVLLVVVAMAYSKHVSAQQYALLGLMAAAAERALPLPPLIGAFCSERGGWFARRGALLAGLLHDGVPLPEALKTAHGLLPREALPLVRAGCESGTLAAALRQALNSRTRHEPVWQAIVPKIVYVCLLPWFLLTILGFILWKIVPQYEKIFKDFRTELPDITRAVIDAGRWGTIYWFLLSWIFVLAAGLAFYALLRYAGAIQWDLPGMGWVVRRLDAAAVLEALSLAVERQRPMTEAVYSLAQSYPKAHVRRRLYRVLDEIDDGQDWCLSLRRHRLLGPADLAVLQAAARTGSLPWAMREMADSNRRRFTYRVHALVQAVFPPIIVAYAFAVTLIVVAMLEPLISLISDLVPR